MYKISVDLPICREPWNITFFKRKSRAVQSLRSGKHLAIMIYHHADTSTFRYRCYNIMKGLDNSSTWDSVYFFVDEIPLLSDLIPHISVCVLVRLKWEHIVAELIRQVKTHNIPVLYDTDDLVCDMQYLPMVTNTLNVHFGSEVDYDFWFSYISRMEYTASNVDGFITTNHFLGYKLKERFGKPYQIIVNSLNQEQLKASERCRAAKSKMARIQPFMIGYFSGTPSHINDFRTVSDEIACFLYDFPDSVLQVVGFMEFPRPIQELIKRKRVQYCSLVDFVELQKLIAQVDVNIVPLVQNVFTNCKSELKFFEAAIVDTPTIAAPTFAYKSAIKDGYNGFLCQPGEVYRRLKQLYADEQFAKSVAYNAREYSLAHFAGDVFSNSIEVAYIYFL